MDEELFDRFMVFSGEHLGEYRSPQECVDAWLDHIDQTAPWLKYEALGFAQRVQRRCPHA